MADARFGLIVAMALAASTPALAQTVDRTRLDQLIAAAEARDSAADPAGFAAAQVAALTEAQRLYPAGHPEIAARNAQVAAGLAANSQFDAALALLDTVTPVLDKAGPAYRGAYFEALGTLGYVRTFKGDHARALDAFTREVAGRRATGVTDKNLAMAISNLAAAKWEAGEAQPALDLNAEAIAMAERLAPIPNDVVVWYANRTVYLFSSGRTDDAIATARAGLARGEAILPADHPLLANLLANLAAMLTRQGRPNDAQAIARRAFELIEKANGKPNQNSATMRVIYAQSLMEAQRYADAEGFLSAAIPIIEGELGPTSDRALLARESRALALMRLDRAGEARAIQQGVIDVRDQRFAPTHRDRMTGRDNLARIAIAQGDLPGAERALTESVDLRTRAVPPAHPDLLAERAMLAMVRSRAGSLPAAALADEARAVFGALKENAGYEISGVSTSRDRAAFAYVAEVLMRAGDAATAFEAQQWSARTSVDDAVASAMAARAAAADPALAARLAERRKLAVERGRLFAAVQAQLQKPDPAFKLDEASANIAAVTERLRAADAALGEGAAVARRFSARPLDAVRRGLGAGDAFLLVTELDDRVGVTALTRDGQAQYLAAEGRKAIAARVERVRATLDPGAAQAAFARSDAAALYDALIGKAGGALIRGKTRLLVSANGALSALPFGVLVPDTRGYLIDRIAVARLPGAPRGDAAVPLAATRALFAMGDVGAPGVAMTQVAMRSGSDARTIGALPRLAGAGAELAEIARAVGVDRPVILTGPDATEAALRNAAIPAGAVVAFATHGLVSGELEGLREPALVLTPAGEDDGLLTASEISAMTIPAGWVILSACNTAAGAGPDAPGLSGLAQAFILAGSDKILATHWPVRDDVARAISVGTLGAAAGGADSAQALRSAIRDVGRGGAIPDGDRPALWAAFELVLH